MRDKFEVYQAVLEAVEAGRSRFWIDNFPRLITREGVHMAQEVHPDAIITLTEYQPVAPHLEHDTCVVTIGDYDMIEMEKIANRRLRLLGQGRRTGLPE